jgi:hypothetical protein
MAGIEFFQTVMGRTFYESSVPLLIDGIERIATMLENPERKPCAWISVKDKQPIKEGWCFVYAYDHMQDQRSTNTAWYKPEEKKWRLIPVSLADTITHWMPIGALD